jgi:hypothetical protein
MLGSDIQFPLCLSNAGHLAGVNNVGAPLPWLFAGGQKTSLEVDLDPTSNFHFGSARGINEHDQVVGNLGIGIGVEIPVIWDPNVGMLHLEPAAYPLGSAQPTAINDNGLVTGWVDFGPQDERAVSWFDTQPHLLPIMPGYSGSRAHDVNSDGDIVGWVVNSGNALATRWTGDVYEDLNTLVDPALGWKLSLAWSINNRGQIAGQGSLHGQPAAWILSPQVTPYDWTHLPAYVAHIAYGVVAGQRGLKIGPHGIEPVPPPNPAWSVLSFAHKAELVGMVLGQVPELSGKNSAISAALAKRVGKLKNDYRKE